jgi:uncharacterized protein (TIGR02265 family)
MSTQAPTQQLWFDVVFEGIFIKGMGNRMTPELKADLLALGVDVTRLGPAYPIPVARKALQAAHKRLYPDMTEAEAFRELGISSVKGYLDTFIGKALLGVVKLIGVRRSLMRLHLTLSGGNNYLHSTPEVIGPTCIEITLNDVSDMPTFWEGILFGGAQVAHAKNLRMSLVPKTPPSYSYRVEWDES